MILLLTTLGVSLNEIKRYLDNKGNLNEFFKLKCDSIEKQIDKLQFNLNSLKRFMKNIDITKTMVNPKIKLLKSFDIYYIEKIGSYIEIGRYCDELTSMFKNKGKIFTTMSIFENPTYQPKESLIKISVIANSELIVKSEYRNIIKKMRFNPGKVITYTHNGAGELLSLFWKELEKYCRLNNIRIRKDLDYFEIYRSVSTDPQKQFFEIYLPIY